MKASFLFIALVIAIGLILRMTLPSHVGFTSYVMNSPRFLPANVIAFWLSLAVVLIYMIGKLVAALLSK